MSVRSEHTAPAITIAAEQQRTEAHLAGVAAADLIATRDVAARDMEEVERQLTWWKSRSPQAQVIPLLQDAYERYALRVHEAGARAADAARAQQDHERAASELDALAMAARAEWEQRRTPPGGTPAAGPPKRTHTPDQKNPDGSTTITMQRCCNGCGEAIGDVTEAEIEASTNGLPLPDVRGECPRCSTLAGPLAAQPGPARTGADQEPRADGVAALINASADTTRDEEAGQ